MESPHSSPRPVKTEPVSASHGSNAINISYTNLNNAINSLPAKQKKKKKGSEGKKVDKDKDKEIRKKKELILDLDGRLTAGTIEAIVQYLLDHSCPPPPGEHSKHETFVSFSSALSCAQFLFVLLIVLLFAR